MTHLCSRLVRAVLVDPGAEAGRAELEGHRLRWVSDIGTDGGRAHFMDARCVFVGLRRARSALPVPLRFGSLYIREANVPAVKKKDQRYAV
jgi:hypothetical protein